VVCLALAPAAARAGIGGSRHDFTGKAISEGGACGACHRPHKTNPAGTAAPPYATLMAGAKGGTIPTLLWPRDLTQEVAYFTYSVDVSSTEPNYVPDTTLLCYDCHDDMTTVDTDPVSTVWGLATNQPMDVAFSQTAGDVARWGSTIGYYENYDGWVPGPGHLPPVAGQPTAGHYWKSEPSGVPDYKKGDKIACSLCHDPHKSKTGTNDVMFRTQFSNGSGGLVPLTEVNNLKSSPNTRYPTTGGTGREMCAACHTYSNAGSGTPVTIWGVIVPKPPTTIPQHKPSETAVCTKCHLHNKINASCRECHGFPPLLSQAKAGGLFLASDPIRKDAENYPGGAGAHQRHKDVLGDAIFSCEICHGPEPGSASWHNFGGGTVLQQNVDLIGQKSFWDPTTTRVGGYDGNVGEANPDANLWEFTAKAKVGGNQTCFSFACHGDPPNAADALKWTDDMVDDDPGSPQYRNFVDNGGVPGDGANICKWCHDATPALLNLGSGTITAPNTMGDGATWGADVNGHGLAAGSYDYNQVGEATHHVDAPPAANKTCTKCHDASYTNNLPPTANTPAKTHFDQANDSANKRLLGTINGVNTIADNPDNTCPACHQLTTGADRAQSPLALVVSHGNSPADGYKPIEPDQFSRNCRQCHEPHGLSWNGTGAIPRNIHMLGKWLDADNDGQPDGAALGPEAARVDSNAVDPTVSITAADRPVIMKNTGVNPTPTTYDPLAEDSWNDGYTDSVADSLCVVCHVSLQRNFSQVGDTAVMGDPPPSLGGRNHNIGGQCRLCHVHGKLSDHPLKAPDAFGPLVCYACHGTPLGVAGGAPAGAVEGQYWPDGRASAVATFNYANNYPEGMDAHAKHMAALAWQVFGETTAQLVSNYTAGNPSLNAYTKQIELCRFCHLDPGGDNHFENDTVRPGGLNRADVKQGTGAVAGLDVDYFRKYTLGTSAYGRTNFASDTTGGAYNFVTDNCANLVCHNQNPTPAAAAGTGTSPGWRMPPNWSTGLTTKCSTTTCHAAPATYTISHNRHSGATNKNYECLECHVNNNALTAPPASATPLGHGNGKVEMNGTGVPAGVWNNPSVPGPPPSPIEGSTFGGGNGYYDKDSSGGPSTGDTGFAYKTGGTVAADPSYAITCSLMYCHGDDNLAGQFPIADRGTDTTPVWNSSATATCGSCHPASAAAPPPTPSHPKHAGNAAGQYAIGCQVCHYSVTTDGSTITGMTPHVNTSVEVSFNGLADPRVDVTSTYGGDTTIGSGYGACVSTYCHSKGTDLLPVYTDPLAVPATSLVWGAAGACFTCHGNGTDSATPAYVDGTPKANKHAIHITTNGFACQICHYTVTTDGTTITDTTLHVNRLYNVAPNAAGPALYQFTWTTPNCDATACHGGNSGITWATAGPYPCQTCHSYVNGGVTNADVNDFAWAGAAPTMSKIAYSEYTAASGGHGSISPRTINKSCNASSCHSSAVAHDTTATLSGANPFRLVDQGGAAGVQFSCSYTGAGCHQSGITGPQTNLDLSTIVTHSPSTMSAAAGYAAKRTWPSWDPQCTNCHDPHGDNNLSMMSRWVFDKAAFNLPAGVAAPPYAGTLPPENTTLVFNDSTTGSSSLGNSFGDQDAPFSSICQECHEAANLLSYKDGGPDTTQSVHPGAPNGNPGPCANCHSHSTGFAPKDCGECHGGKPSLYPVGYATHPGVDGTHGNADDAPNVMSVLSGGIWYSVWDGAWWDNFVGSSTAQRGGHGDAGGRPTVFCTDCHDINRPLPNTHLDGTVNTFDFPGKGSTTNSNTSHLKAYFVADLPQAVDAAQLQFDDSCAVRVGCHSGVVPEYRHTVRWKSTGRTLMQFQAFPPYLNTITANPKQARAGTLWVNYWTPWTMKDLQNTVTGAVQHGVCVSCHDPHGTRVTENRGGTNLMLRYNGFILKPEYPVLPFTCYSNCHKLP
jgi:predicted CxxxxCH...CXXCH cytochrome family protein